MKCIDIAVTSIPQLTAFCVSFIWVGY